jgi:rubrerythrin
MIHDEYKAPFDYLKIKRLLSKKKDKKIVDGIIKQERQHHSKVIKIARRELKRK